LIDNNKHNDNKVFDRINNFTGHHVDLHRDACSMTMVHCHHQKIEKLVVIAAAAGYYRLDVPIVAFEY
jgi:hypothetical protein